MDYDIADEETIRQLTPEQLLRLQNNQVIYKRVQKELHKQTDLKLRIALAESLWESAIIDLLEYEADSPKRLEWFKDKIKMHSQLVTMRIQSLIDAYPDALKSEEFRKVSHEEYRKWVGR